MYFQLVQNIHELNLNRRICSTIRTQLIYLYANRQRDSQIQATQAFHKFEFGKLDTFVAFGFFLVRDLVPALGPTRGIGSGEKSKFTADGKRLAWIGTPVGTDRKICSESPRADVLLDDEEDEVEANWGCSGCWWPSA